MPFRSVSNPEQVAILNAVLEDLCSAVGIVSGSPERQVLADLIVSLFWDGHNTSDELRQALAKRIDWGERRYG